VTARAWASSSERVAELTGWAVFVAALAFVVVYPFCAVDLPPIGDMPAHGSSISVLRHYFDPTWHFREQFSFHPLESPYAFLYGIGALLALVMPIAWATKIVFILAIATLPIGLAVLFKGLKKSPLLGVLGLVLAWTTPTQWGFLNHVAAVGFYLMSIGATLLALDRPTRGRQSFLAVSLFLVFLSHVFRMPFALLSVIATTVVMYPATKRVRPVVLPFLGGVACMVAWQLVRRTSMKAEAKLDFQGGRLAEVWPNLFSGYALPEERVLAQQALTGVVALFAVCFTLYLLRIARRRPTAAEWTWSASATTLMALLSAGALLGYLMLPMSIGLWWWVYPREILTTLLLAFALVPDLPRNPLLRLSMIGYVAVLAGRIGQLNVTEFRKFNAQIVPFREILAKIPKAPKLAYLIFDHSGTSRLASPFVHLPLWVQAEKGGWLSWHFAVWGLHPLRYRPGPDSPPERKEERWEWRPDMFDVQRDGPFFDTFLVRSVGDPGYVFARDRSIAEVAHVGSWWLYRRNLDVSAAAAAAAASPPPADAPGAGVTLEGAVLTRGCTVDAPRVTAGGEVGLRCWFDVKGPVPDDWSIFVHVEDPRGNMRVHADHPPVGGSRPTNTWRAGETIRDVITLKFPSDAEPGTYHVYFGFWRGVAARTEPARLLEPKGRIIGPTIEVVR
jgi:hypothetical protein